MDKNSDLLRRPLYVYSLPAEVLDSLAYKDVSGAAAPVSSEKDQPGQAEKLQSDTLSSGLACALCSQAFSSVAGQRSHLKSDLHHYNLKQKLRGLAPVSEAEFERLAGNLEESLSGSDWSESDESDEESTKADSVDTASSSGNVLATLLKKQAVLAEAKRKEAERFEEDDDDGSGPRRRKGKNGKAAAAALSNQPLVWFTSPVLDDKPNTYFGVYKAIFTKEELEDEEKTEGEGGGDSTTAVPKEKRLADALRTRQLAPISGAVGNAATANVTYTGRHIFMCMIGGGHFAAMVVALAPRRTAAKSSGGAHSVPMNREATVLAHKTYHRYTTRRKQGGSQSANDNAKGAAHSAGSTLRRYNEQALVDDVRALLQDWKRLLDTADLLFIRATGTTNQRTLFGPYDGQVLQARDPRIRGFPFTTRRPTQNEIMRCFIELTRLKVREIVPAKEKEELSATAGKQATAPKKAAPKRSEEEETALLHTSQLQNLARRSKVPALLAYLKSNNLSAANFRFVSDPNDATNGPNYHLHHAPTLLHLAAAQGSPALVNGLLLRTDADPAAQNGDGKTPFELAGDRATRDAFRVARGELETSSSTSHNSNARKIDWEATHIPTPLSRAEAEKRDARERDEAVRKETERRRVEEARLKAEAKPAEPSKDMAFRRRPGIGVPKSAQEIFEEQTRGMTPQQKQRLERERRARAAEERIRRMQSGQ